MSKKNLINIRVADVSYEDDDCCEQNVTIRVKDTDTEESIAAYLEDSGFMYVEVYNIYRMESEPTRVDGTIGMYDVVD